MSTFSQTLVGILLLTGCAGEAGTQQPPRLGGAAPASGQALPGEPAASAGALRATLARTAAQAGEPLWLAWEVPAVASLRGACCFDRQYRTAACRLEERNQGWGTQGDDPPGSGRLLVLARWAGGEVTRVRAVEPACALDPGPLPLVHLPAVSGDDSARFLAELASRQAASREGGRAHFDESLAALAHHGGEVAERALRELASDPHPARLREQALFWIGQARGEPGARFLAGVARQDPQPAIREKAIFALSQNGSALATETLGELARHDENAKVRGEALFWLAQTRSATAPPVLLAALDEDPSPHVRNQAIFAMTQLRDGDGIPLLIDIVRQRRDPELRRQALFWLGQSDDPRALDFLERILTQ